MSQDQSIQEQELTAVREELQRVNQQLRESIARNTGLVESISEFETTLRLKDMTNDTLTRTNLELNAHLSEAMQAMTEQEETIRQQAAVNERLAAQLDAGAERIKVAEESIKLWADASLTMNVCLMNQPEAAMTDLPLFARLARLVERLEKRPKVAGYSHHDFDASQQ